MICFKIGNVELARGKDKTEILNKKVKVYTNSEIKEMSLEDALNNGYEFILSEEIEESIKGYINDKSKTINSLEGFPNSFKNLYESEQESYVVDEEEKPKSKNVTTNPITKSQTNTTKESNKVITKGVYYRIIKNPNDTSANSRRPDGELEKNPYNLFFQYLTFGQNGIEFRGIKFPKEIQFKAITFSEFRRLLIEKKYEDTTNAVKEDGNLVFESENPNTDLVLILVDEKGEPFLINNHLIRTSNDGKFSSLELKEGTLYTLSTEYEDTSNDKLALYPIDGSEGKTFTKEELNSMKANNVLFRIQVPERGKIRPGEMFLSYPNTFVNQNTFVKFSKRVLTQTDYENILSNIQRIIQETLNSSSPDLEVISRYLPNSWNRLIKHNFQKNNLSEFLYKDFAQGVGVTNPIYINGKPYMNGVSIAINDSNTERILIFKDGIFRNRIVNDKIESFEIKLDEASTLIKTFADKSLAPNKNKNVPNERKLSLPLVKSTDPGSSASLDLYTQFQNIFGYRDEKGNYLSDITTLDIIAREFKTQVKYTDGYPAMINMKFSLIPKIDSNPTVNINKEKETESSTKKVEITKKRVREIKRNKTLEQIGETITQSDIDNVKKVFPSLQDREVRILAATANTDYWGRVTKQGLYLLESATTGTLYHEAWHEFSQWYLTKNQKTKLYEKVFSIIGINDREEAEEFLAEEFAKFRLGLPINPKLEAYFKRETNWFRSILNFLRNLFGYGSYNILNQFKELNLVLDGKKKLKYYSENNVEFSLLNKAIVVTEDDKEKVVFSNAEMIKIVNLFDSLLFKYIEELYVSKVGNYSYFSEVGSSTIYKPNVIVSSYIKDNNYSNLFKILKYQVEELKDLYAYETGEAKNTIEKLDKYFNLVVDSYIKETLLPFKNVKGVELDENEEIITRNSANFKEGNETEVTVDMDLEIKTIISSLKKPKPNIKMTEEQFREANEILSETDDEGTFHYYSEDATLKRNEFYEINDMGFSFNTVNLSETNNKIFSLLSNITDYSDMLDVLKENAENNPEFWELLSKLPTKEDLRAGSREAIKIATKFESCKRVMFPFYNSIMNVNIDSKIVQEDSVEDIGDKRAEKTSINFVKEIRTESTLTEAVKNNLEAIKKANSISYSLNKNTLVVQTNNGEVTFNSIYDLYIAKKVVTDFKKFKEDFKDAYKNGKLSSKEPYSSVILLRNEKENKRNNKLKDENYDTIEFNLFMLETIGISLTRDTIIKLLNSKDEASYLETSINILFFTENKGIFNYVSIRERMETTLGMLKEKYPNFNKNDVFIPSDIIDGEGNVVKPDIFLIVDGKKVKSLKVDKNFISFKSLQSKYLTIINDVPFENFLVRGLSFQAEATNITNIFKFESKHTTLAYTTVVKNASGDLVNTLYLYNSLSKMLSAINDTSCKTLQEVVAKYPYVEVLNNFLNKERNLLTNNIYLQQIFQTNGQRKTLNGVPVKLEWSNLGGNILQINGEEVSSDSSTKLTEIDKLIQNLITEGNGQRIKRPGDKSTESIIKIDLPYKQVDEYKNVLLEYFTNELIYTKLIKKGTLKEFIYLQDKVEDLFDKYFVDNGLDINAVNIANFVRVNQGTFLDEISKFIQKDIDYYVGKIEGYGLRDLAVKILNADTVNLEKSVEKLIYNKHVNSITQNFLFYGYTGLYADMFKRNSNIISTGIFPSTDKNIIEGINKMYKYSHGNILRLLDNEEFKEKHTAILQKQIPNEDKYAQIKQLIDEYSEEGEFFDKNNPIFNVDVIPKKQYIKESRHLEDIRKSLSISSKVSKTGFDVDEIVNAYRKLNLADAQAWVSFDFYRNFKVLIGKWSDEQEYLYQMLSAGINIKTYKGNKVETFFPPIKPQYAGFTPSNKIEEKENLEVKQAFDKLSFMPYIPFVFDTEDSSEFEAFGKNLSKNNIAYVMTEDALKLGEKGERYLANIKEQINIEAHDHDASTFPKQLLQIISGFGKDENGEWLKFDNGKEIVSFETLAYNFESKINELTNTLREELETEIGYSVDEQGVVSVDLDKLKVLIDAELQSRQFKKPIIDAVDIIENKGVKEFRYNLELVLAKQSISSLLHSITNRRLVRLKVNGDMAVQVSSYMIANELMFYKIGKINGKQQTLPASCKLALRGQWEKLLSYKDSEGKKIKTLKRLNELLKELKVKLTTDIDNITLSEWEINFLNATQITGVRIPTQGLNSMEFLFVEEFLDPKVGSLIVLHEEITTKSGSDFDIDKLVLMYPYLETIGKERLSLAENNELNELSTYFEDNSVKENKKNLKELEAEIEVLKEAIKTNKDTKAYFKEVVKILKQHKKTERDYLIEQAKLSEQYTQAVEDRDYGTVEYVKEKQNENKEAIQERREYIDSLYKMLEENKENIELNKDTLEYKLATDELLTKNFEELESKFKSSIENIEEIKKYNRFLELKSRSKETHFIHNEMVYAIRELLSNPIRYIELIYPNSTELIGSGSLTIEKDGKKVADKDLAVNKLEIKRLFELVMSSRIEYPNLFDSEGKLLVEKFLDWTLEVRNKSLNTAFAEANSQRAEDIKFVNGLGTKRLVGIGALQVTMINLISNLNIGVSTTLRVSDKTYYNLPLDYYSSDYLRKINQGTHLNFSVVTDNFKKKSFNDDLSVKVEETNNLIKRVLAEQMVNPIVDSLNDKNPISQINVNEITLATVEFMAIYLGISIDVVYNLINQPLVLRHIANKAINKSSFLNKFKKELGKEKEKEGFGLIESVLLSLGISPKDIIKKLKSGNYKNITQEDVLNLFDTVGKKSKDLSTDEVLKQVQYLADYVKFEAYAEEYRQLQSSTNWATNTQNNFLESYQKLLEYEEVSRKGVFTNIDKLQKSVVSNFKVQDLNVELMRHFFPMTTDNKFINVAVNLSEYFKSTDKSSFYRLFLNDYFKFILDNTIHDENFFRDNSELSFLKNLSKELFINVSNAPTQEANTNLVETVLSFKKDERFKNNEFIKRLEVNKKNGLKYNISVLTSTSEVSSSDAITEGILDLVKQEPEIGNKFVMLGLLQDGLNKSPISWSEYIAPELYYDFMEKALSYFENKYKDNMDTILVKYTYLFFKNNPKILGNSKLESDENALERFFRTKGFEIEKTAVSGYTYKNYFLVSPLNKELSPYKNYLDMGKILGIVNLDKGFIYETNKKAEQQRALNSTDLIVYGDSIFSKNLKEYIKNTKVELNPNSYTLFSNVFVGVEFLTYKAINKNTKEEEIEKIKSHNDNINNIKNNYVNEINKALQEGAIVNFEKFDKEKQNTLRYAILDTLEKQHKNNLQKENGTNSINLKLKKIAGANIINKNLVVKTNGIVLNEGQKIAVEKLDKFMKDKKAKFFLLEGSAGTGKTTVISSFRENINTEIINSSPTNAANDVTLSFDKYAKVLTLHQLLELKADIDIENYDLKKVSFTRKDQRYTKVRNGVTVLIDESSMISENIYAMIKILQKEKNLKIIFIGDREQLPPVRKDNSTVEKDAISPVFTDEEIKEEYRAELTEVMRTGKTPVLNESVFVRKNNRFSYETDIQEDSSVEFINEDKVFEDKIKNFVQSEEFKNNKNYFRLLTGKIEYLDYYNELLRKAYHEKYSKGLKELGLIEVGDLLVGVSNFDINQITQTPLIVNSSSYEVVSKVESSKEIYIKGKFHTITGFDLEVKSTINNDLIKVFLADEKANKESLIALGLEIMRLYENSKGNSDNYKEAVRMQSLITIMNPILDPSNNKSVILKSVFNYGYAVTVHKSQGATFTNTGIIDKGNNLNFTKNLKYTAISRARKNSIILTNNSVTIKKKKAEKIDFEKVTENKNEDNVKADFESEMNYSYGNEKREGITSNTTLEAIKKGERTATTRFERHVEYWKKAKIGDIIKYKNKEGDSVLVEVTKPLHKLKGSGKTREEWSKLEGWSIKHFNDKVLPFLDEAWQIEYKLYEPKSKTENLDKENNSDNFDDLKSDGADTTNC